MIDFRDAPALHIQQVDRRAFSASGPLFKFAAGDSVAGKGGTFTRAGTRTYYDVNGVRQTASSGQCIGDGSVKHYLSATAHLLLQPARTNSALWAEDLTNAAWTKLGATPTTVGGSVTDMMGGTNTKCGQIGGNGAFADQGFVNATAYVWTAATPQGFAFDVKPGNKGNFFILTTDGVATAATSWGNASTGATGTTAGTHTLKFWGVQSNGWYRFEFRLSTSGATVVLGKTLRFSFCDADNSTTLTGDGATVNGSFNAIQHEQDQGWVSSYIPTTNAAVTAVVDTLSFPHNSVPKPRTLYADMTSIDIAQNSGDNVDYFAIGGIAGANNQYSRNANGVVRGAMNNNAVFVAGATGVTPPLPGNRFEVRSASAVDTTVTGGISINLAAETTVASAASAAFQGAYATANYTLLDTAIRPIAVRVVKDLNGAQIMTICRSA